MIDESKLEPARWPGGPRICTEVNLPAFEDIGAMKEFETTRCPSVRTGRVWQCDACGCWHSATPPITSMERAVLVRRIGTNPSKTQTFAKDEPGEQPAKPKPKPKPKRRPAKVPTPQAAQEALF